MSSVKTQVEEGIATIVLNRPERLNAFTDEMESELIDAFDRTDADDDVKVVLLTGAGRAFCAGMDLTDAGDAFVQWRTSTTAPEGTQFEFAGEQLPMRRDGGGRVVLRIHSSLKPVIAAVNGPAVGVGATMVLACDLRLCSDTAKFGFVFNRRGLVPESCSSWFLPRVVPMQRALEWMLTGRVFPASEALEHALVHSVHPADELMKQVKVLAHEIADNTAPVSAALTRQLLWRMLGADHPMAAHQAETIALNLRGVSNDAREGLNAFMAKRAPEFPDRVSADLPAVFGFAADRRFDPAEFIAIADEQGPDH